MTVARLGALLGVLISVGQAHAATNFPTDTVERGRYLAVAGDCTACHTAPAGGKPFAGGYAIASPLGPIYASNITPSLKAGIGAYTERQFSAALREGVRAAGAHLYPAMPYTAYAGLSDDDVHALFAYFMQGVAPVDAVPPQTHLPFPFDLRFSMAVWDALFLRDARFQADPSKSAAWNRGAYLVGALEHCSACHSPRNLLMAESTGSPFAGGPVGAWYAPNITADPVSGIGGWSHAELVQYLKTGAVHAKNQAAGGMAEAVADSLQYLSPQDLDAIVTYLQTIKPIRAQADQQPAYNHGGPAVFEAVLRGAAGPAASGAALFSGYCASCHQPSGAGSHDHAYPTLFHNTATGAHRADNLVAAILDGVDREAGGRHAFMPRFDDASYVQPLTDAQIASISNYVLQTFGDPKVQVTAQAVATARKGGAASPLIELVDYGLPLAVAVAVALLGFAAWLIWRRRV
jgi:mono/diheme cytochrome c family protein